MFTFGLNEKLATDESVKVCSTLPSCSRVSVTVSPGVTSKSVGSNRKAVLTVITTESLPCAWTTAGVAASKVPTQGRSATPPARASTRAMDRTARDAVHGGGGSHDYRAPT